MAFDAINSNVDDNIDEIVSDFIDGDKSLKVLYGSLDKEGQEKLVELYKNKLFAAEKVAEANALLENAKKVSNEASDSLGNYMDDIASKNLTDYLSKNHNEFAVGIRWDDSKNNLQSFIVYRGEDMTVPASKAYGQSGIKTISDGDVINITDPDRYYMIPRAEFNANFREPNLEELMAVDRKDMNEYQKVYFVMEVRKSLSDEEQDFFDKVYSEINISDKYNNSLDIDLEACEAVLEQRRTKEEELMNSLEDIDMENKQYDNPDKEKTVEDYQNMDRDSMSDEDKVEYVSLVRKSMDDMEKEIYAKAYDEAWMSEKYDNTLDVDVVACDKVIEHRKEREDEMTQALNDAFEREANQKSEITLEELQDMDRNSMSDDEKVIYVSKFRNSMTKDEKEKFDRTYSELWESHAHNNTLDCEVGACDVILKDRRVLEEQLMSGLDDLLNEQVEKDLRDFEKEPVSFSRNLKDDLDRDLRDIMLEDLEKNPPTLGEDYHIEDNQRNSVGGWIERAFGGKDITDIRVDDKKMLSLEEIDSLNKSVEALVNDFDIFIKKAEEEDLKVQQEEDIKIGPYELASKRDLMSQAVLGLSAENNEFVVYMEDTRCSYSLGSDVTKVYDEMDKLTDKMVSGAMVVPLQEEVDVAKIQNIHDLNLFAMQEAVLNNKVNTAEISEDSVLAMLAEQRKVNMQHLAVVGPGKNYDKAFLVDNNYNRVAVLEVDSCRGIIDNPLGDACKFRTPFELEKYANADLVLHNFSEIKDAIKDAKSIYVDSERCNQMFEKGMLNYISSVRNGKEVHRLSAFEASQCYEQSGYKHRIGSLAQHRGRSMELGNEQNK